MRRFLVMAILVSFVAQVPAAEVGPLVTNLMANARQMDGVRFHEVIHAATGKHVIPLSLTNTTDRALIAKIGQALDVVLRKLNDPEGPAQRKRRINEVSALFEGAMRSELNAVNGFQCDYPRLSSGNYQRAGYPDLRLVDRTSGRIVYLDPKLFERGAGGSSLRTFYYEPKRDTTKVLDDAHHLIVGFEHDGRQNGTWQFLNWELVDLSNLRVKLKAEFQASNRDLYRPEATVARSRTNSIVGTPP